MPPLFSSGSAGEFWLLVNLYVILNSKSLLHRWPGATCSLARPVRWSANVCQHIYLFWLEVMFPGVLWQKSSFHCLDIKYASKKRGAENKEKAFFKQEIKKHVEMCLWLMCFNHSLTQGWAQGLQSGIIHLSTGRIWLTTKESNWTLK